MLEKLKNINYTTNIKYSNNLREVSIMKRYFYLIAVLMLFASVNLFGQDTNTQEEKKENKAWNYMKGRSLFGLNFGPTLYAGVFDRIIGSTIIPFDEMLTSAGADLTGRDMNRKHWAFGLGFSYDFAPLDFMSVGFDIGFAVGEVEVSLNKVKYSTIPWSLNVKFFFFKKAPFGFFLSPRFGGTAIRVTSSWTDAEVSQNVGGETRFRSDGGFYMSLELGWRIQLFPKRGADWPVQVGIDVSLFDIGYYVAPWTSTIFNNTLFTEISGYQKLFNIRALILPRLGITLRF